MLSLYLGTFSVVVIGLSRAVFIDLRKTEAGAEFLLLRLSSRIEKRTFGLACNADCVPKVSCETVRGRMVLHLVSHAKDNEQPVALAYTDAVVPNSNIILLPLISDVDLLRGGNDFVEVPNDGIAFRLRDADDARDKARIEK